MKIIVLGAGQVGSTVAENLSSEANDITIVDQDAERLRNLQDHLDVRTVTGNASHPGVLARAGAKDADLILAVTSSDETNMVACQVAYTLFQTPTKIARVRAAEYLEHPILFCPEALPVDVHISPEQLVTDYIQRLIETPGALQVLDFANGKVRLVAVRAYHGGPLVGHALRELPSHMPAIDTRVAAIFRRGSAIVPEGSTVIEVDDEVFFVAAAEHIGSVMGELRRRDRAVRRIILAGGGNIGRRLARALEPHYHVKLVEYDLGRARRLSEHLDRTIVLNGHATDEELLREENIDGTDVFCAVTNDDQSNILSAMLAKQMGARKVMALINREGLCRSRPERPRRHRDFSSADDDQRPPRARAPGRRGRGALAPARRGGSDRSGRARRPSHFAGGGTQRGRNQVASRHHHRRHRARRKEVIIAHHDTRDRGGGPRHPLPHRQETRIAEVERLFQVGITFL